MEVKFIDVEYPDFGYVPYSFVGTQTVLPMTQEEADQIKTRPIGFIWDDNSSK